MTTDTRHEPLTDAEMEDLESGSEFIETMWERSRWPLQIRRLLAEVRLRRVCHVCAGKGTFVFVEGFEDQGPNEPKEITCEGACPECEGTGVAPCPTPA